MRIINLQFGKKVGEKKLTQLQKKERENKNKNMNKINRQKIYEEVRVV